MNEQQLELLLEEALQSVQESIPSMVQTFQQNGTFGTTLASLDISNQYTFFSPPQTNESNDLSANPIQQSTTNETNQGDNDDDTRDEIGPEIHIINTDENSATDASNNSFSESIQRLIQSIPINFQDSTGLYGTSGTSSNTTSPVANITPQEDNDTLLRLSVVNAFSDYQENMRQYNQNVSPFLRTIGPCSRLRSRGLNNQTQPSILRRTTPLSPILTTVPERLFRQSNPQLTFEFQARPFAFEPSVPVPTLEQFMNSTESYVFNSGTVSRVHSMTCPITLEDFQYGELLCEIKHCRHVFKESALRNWFIRNTHCPVCRYDIRTSATNSQNATPSTRAT